MRMIVLLRRRMEWRLRLRDCRELRASLLQLRAAKMERMLLLVFLLVRFRHRSPIASSCAVDRPPALLSVRPSVRRCSARLLCRAAY